MRPPSGEQHEIRSGAQRAVVTEVGATLREYSVGDRAILDGFSATEMNHGSRGAVLAPWPNRTAGGRWTTPGGDEEQLPVSEPRTGSALHGLVSWVPWQRAGGAADAVSLECVLPACPGYPYTLHLRADYALDGGGLRCTVTALNGGDGVAPYGIGHHPYVACPDGVDAATLHLPAARRLELDDRGIPSGSLLDVAGTPYDFRIPRRVDTLRLDTCYTALERDGEGRIRVAVDDITVWMDAPFAWVMVYSGDTLAPQRRRRGLAVEPMTCPPDALNSGQGIVLLRPGERVSTSWGVCLSGPGGPAPRS